MKVKRDINKRLTKHEAEFIDYIRAATQVEPKIINEILEMMVVKEDLSDVTERLMANLLAMIGEIDINK